MNTYLISYDLVAPGRDYQLVYDYMKKFGERAKPLYTVYLVYTDKLASQIRDELKNLVDTNDKILVIKVDTSAWASFNLSTSADWLKAH